MKRNLKKILRRAPRQYKGIAQPKDTLDMLR